ncbi:MAG: response regulator [Chloroflexota bacterium]
MSAFAIVAGLGTLLNRQSDDAARHRTLCEQALQALGAESVAFWLVDEPSQELVAVLTVHRQGAASLPDDLRLDDPRHPIASTFLGREVQAIQGPLQAEYLGGGIGRVGALLTAPVLTSLSGTCIGVLAAALGDEATPCDERHREVASIISQIAGPLLAPKLENAPHAAIPPRLDDPNWLLEALPDGVLLVAPNGSIERLNQAAASLLGLRSTDWVGRHARDVPWPLADENGLAVPFERQPIGLALRDRAVPQEREMLATSSLGQRMVRVTASFVDTAEMGSPRMVVLIRDLSEHRELLQQLTRTETMRIVGQLASAAIHDINNWFGLILGQAELMLVADPPGDMIDGLESVRKAACDGAEALKRIQDLARSSVDVDPTPVDVNQVLREVVDITRPKWSDLLQSSGASTSVMMDLAVPLAPILAVPSELREVFTNLILNAVDAMPHGGALRVASKRQRNRIVVTIADSGTGMPEEIRARIFEPFFTTKGARGSGLGLAVSKTMVERHGGRISVESELGQGTRFVLSFAPAEKARLTSATPEVPAPRPSRVLLVEDDQHMRDLMVKMLERDRHTVTPCRSGREAIVLLGQEVFDIVLTDLVMPLADGWDVAQATRKAQPTVPVILITGSSQRFSEAELRARGVTARLNKPFRLDQLRRAIGNVLATTDPVSTTAAQPRILAVDDDPAMTRMLSAMLQTSGCEIQTANDGVDASLLMDEASRAGRPFGLLFTDMNMAEMNGAELIQRARGINPRIVTILLSGDTPSGVSAGADLSLQKPYSLAALLSVLDQGLALHKRVTSSTR